MEENFNMKPQKHIAVKIFLTIIILGIILSISGGIWLEKTKEKYAEEKESFTKEYQCTDINNLEINTGVGRIYLKPAEDNMIRVDACNIPKNYYIFSNDNQTFKIKTENKKTQKYVISLMNYQDDYKDSKITVYIPQDKYYNLKINGGVGETHIEGIKCESAELEQGVGLCTYRNLTVCGKTKIDCGVGETNFEDCNFSDTDIECGIGQTNFSGKLNGDISVDGGVGDISLNIDGYYEDYKIENSSENVKIYKGESHTNAASINHKITVDSGIGTIKILFK